MRRVLTASTIALMTLLQAACWNHGMVDRQFTVVDTFSSEPIAGANMSVRYGIVPCGTPFGFLGGPDYPETPPETTNAQGEATLTLASDWVWGFIITIDAQRYQQGKIEVGDDRLHEGIPFDSLPRVVGLQRQEDPISLEELTAEVHSVKWHHAAR